MSFCTLFYKFSKNDFTRTTKTNDLHLVNTPIPPFSPCLILCQFLIQKIPDSLHRLNKYSLIFVVLLLVFGCHNQVTGPSGSVISFRDLHPVNTFRPDGWIVISQVTGSRDPLMVIDIGSVDSQLPVSSPG